jgi:ribonuclease BN (tRNA processing enzyme)
MIALLLGPTMVHPEESVQSAFITLGTSSGPIAKPLRSQPANLLHAGDQYVLIDAGDGAAEQLAKAGISLDKIQTVMLSHHHFDHTGGLFAILGMRFQTLVTQVLTIYGPLGTKQLVDGLLAAMQPMVDESTTMKIKTPILQGSVKVVEVTDRSKFTLGKITITAAVNSHYTLEAGSPEAAKYQSLSYRFDMPDRSIVYTGDTGPSPNVEQLAHKADLLVSEILDPEQAMAQLKRQRPDIPPAALEVIEGHFRREHLSPREVGLLAHRSDVKSLVLTHNPMDAETQARAKSTIAAQYKGPIDFAEDLDSF